MERTEFIGAMCAAINKSLSTRAGLDVTDLQQHGPVDLFESIMATYAAAIRPTDFYHVPIWKLDDRFEQAYELLRMTFAPEVLDPREMYVNWLAGLNEPPDESVMIGRFWRVSGRQTYDAEGVLTHFKFDPLTSTESIVGVVIGDFTQLNATVGFGAIGYLATRPALRGQGHGQALTHAFDEAVAGIAQQQGLQLVGNVLEAEDRARQFWAKQGYRYPRDSQYVQPSLNFDPVTGQPLDEPVPEMLMLKFVDERASVPRDELIAIVRRLYENWYMPELAAETAMPRANQHVFDTCLQGFIDSVAASSEQIDLIWPPE